MSVGVRDLKQNLSAYIARAAAGERIVVTDRGRPRAVLSPLDGADVIRRGVEEGWITPPADPGPLPPPPVRAKATMTIQEMMDEDRGE